MIKRLFKKTAACFITAVFILAGTPGNAAKVQADTEVIEKPTEAEAADEKEENTADGEAAEDAVLLTADGAEDAAEGIYAEKLDIPEDFYTGVDISSYLSEVESGVKYYGYDGNELDDAGFFKLLKDSGINSVRIRVWNDPYDASGHGYGGGNCDIDRAIIMGKAATDAGLKVLIDFHYSDFWADPGKQKAPKAWEGMSVEDKAKALHDYTADCMKRLKDAGVNVTMVQLGNETTTGMCGEKSWTDICTLMKAGSEAVHEVSPEVERVVHFTDAHTSNYYGFARYLDNNGVEYEIFASSYYPYWHGTLENLRTQLGYVIDNFDKKVMVVETSYVYTLDDGDGSGNTIGEGTSGVDMDYQVSEQGQVNLIHDITETVLSCDGKGVGVFWWEPAWIPVGVVDGSGSASYDSNSKLWEQYGSGWANAESGDYDSDAAEWYGGSAVDNQALFDFYGHPLQSLKVFDLLRNGSEAPYKITGINSETVTFGINDEIVLPETVQVVFTDDKKIDAAVTWDEAEIKKAQETGSGIYTINGKAEVDGQLVDVSCELRLNEDNLLKNPGFEEDSMSCWTIVDDNNGGMPCASRKDDSSNVRTGSFCLHFWSKDEISYKVSQTVYLKKGTYKVGAWVEGGDTGKDADIKLFAKTASDDYDAAVELTGWQQYKNPEINDIDIAEDGTALTIGVSVKCAGNGWGAWDDFYLYSTAPGGGIMEGMENVTEAPVEAPTEAVTEAKTTSSDDKKTEAVDDEEEDDSKSGKGAIIAIVLASLAIVILAVFIIISKARPDDNTSDDKGSKGKKE